MLRDTETEQRVEAKLFEKEEPPQKWTCKRMGRATIIINGVVAQSICIARSTGLCVPWSFKKDDWCYPILFED